MSERDLGLTGEVETAACAPRSAALPNAPQILSAFLSHSVEDDELLRYVHAVGKLHFRHGEVHDAALIGEIDRRRDELMEEIENWFLRERAQTRGSLAGQAEMLSAAIDRMACGWVMATRPTIHDGQQVDSTHKQWLHMAELVDIYNNLTRHMSGDNTELYPRPQESQQAPLGC